MPTPAQVKMIHVLKNDLHLGNDEYHNLLSASYTPGDGPINSSKELSIEQASAIIRALEHLIDQTPAIRDHVYASDKQVKKIFALWRQVTIAHDDEGVRKTLQSFLEHHFHVRDINHLPKKKVPKIIKALTSIKNKTRSSNDKKEEY